MSETVIVQTNAQYEQSYFKAGAVGISHWPLIGFT